MRRVDRHEPFALGAQAIIEVVVDDQMRLVEPAEPGEGFTPRHQARAGQRDDVALGARQAEIAGLVFREIAEGVAPLAHRGEEQAGMLDAPVGVEKERADRADVWPLRLSEQRVEPIRLDDLGIVVEKEQELALGRFRGEIVEARPVVGLGRRDDPVGVALQPIPPLAVGGRNIFDTDDFIFLVAGEAAQALDAGLDHALRGAGRDDDRDKPFCRERALDAIGAGNKAGPHLAGDAAPL